MADAANKVVPQAAPDQVLRGKPRRNLHWWVGGMVAGALVTIMLYKAIQPEHAAPLANQGPAQQDQDASAEKVKQDEIKKIIADQRRSVAPTPEPERTDGTLPPAEPITVNDGLSDLKRAAAVGQRVGNAAHQEDARRREEQILAAPILVSTVSVGTPSRERAAGTGFDGQLRQLEEEIRARSRPGNPEAQDPAAAAAKVMASLSPAPQAASQSDVRWQADQEAVALSRTQEVIRARPPASRFIVHEGTLIPAVLVTKLNSDLPGRVMAVVTQDVYDTISSRFLMIPKGSRIIGRYNNDVRPGQDRVMLAFGRIVFPNGVSATLPGMPGVDTTGQSGLADEVDTHFWEIFGASFLIAAISAALPSQDVTVNNFQGGSTTVMNAATMALNDTSRAILDRRRNIPPTITVREGFRFNVTVARDMVLEPYRD